MEKELNHLSTCIERQLTLYRKLLDLFLVERRAILDSELEMLNKTVMEKEVLLQKIRREEVQRQQTSEALSLSLGVASSELTITRLSQRIREPYASDIKRKGAKLQSLIDEIQVESGGNRSLCLQALQFVNGSLKMLTTLTRPNQVYHATGRVQNAGQVGRMLSGAV